MGRQLKIVTTDNKLWELRDIDEYVSGYKYFYIRFSDSKVITVDRDVIKKVLRVGADGRDREIFLKKVPSDS